MDAQTAASFVIADRRKLGIADRRNSGPESAALAYGKTIEDSDLVQVFTTLLAKVYFL